MGPATRRHTPLSTRKGVRRNRRRERAEAVERVRELTGGFGAHSVLECVGYEQSTVTALGIARPGEHVTDEEYDAAPTP